MAKRRMFNIALMESDGFYELSSLTQALYFHLCLNADDDGIVDNVKSIMRDLKASSKNYIKLIEEGYIIELNKRVIAITHWLQHNRIKSDRYTQTTYQDLLKMLSRDKNDRYFKVSEEFCGDKSAPQYSIGKYSSVKNSIEKDSIAEKSIAEIKEEKKIEEGKEDNISFFHSNNQSMEALPPREQQESNLFPLNIESDTLSHSSFINAIKLYFMKKYQSLESREFIRYYDERDWVGEWGKVNYENYKYYVDEWMKK